LRIRLYLDEDAIDSEVIAGLRSSRVDVFTAKDAGMLSRDDEDVLAFAAAQARVLYSFNKGHFLRLHTSWSLAGRGHAGIVLAQQKVILLANRFEGSRILSRACPPKRCATASNSSAVGERRLRRGLMPALRILFYSSTAESGGAEISRRQFAEGFST
jgi:hypothetical protein